MSKHILSPGSNIAERTFLNTNPEGAAHKGAAFMRLSLFVQRHNI